MGLSLREGVPLVKGEKRDRRADFQALYPIIISGARISRTIGKVEGEIPLIREMFISALNTPDPFEEGKLMKDTWVFVVDPAQIKRTAGVQTPLDFNSEGKLIEVFDNNKVQSGKELVIPLSLKNLKMCFSYPLEGKENMPVFSKYCEDEVFDPRGASSNETSVYFMRKCIVEASRNLTYAKQKELVGGFDITPLRVRALFDAIVILESGTCPDVDEPRGGLARCPDVVHSAHNNPYADIGRFAPRFGLQITFHRCKYEDIGVAPCVSVGVLQ